MIRRLLLSTVLSVCALHSLPALEHPVFSAMDVFALEWASDPQISPDGEQVAYVRNGMDIMLDKASGNLWIINSDGGKHKKLTSRETAESSPVWSPDGKRIAFISKDEIHGAELFMYWVSDGKTARISQLERSPSNLKWAPDGSRLSFTMLVPEEPPVLVKGPEKPNDK